jgi:hypothetical protein
MDTSNEQKTSKQFCCKYCDYITSKQHNYDRHILTDKHKRIHFGLNGVELLEQNEQQSNKKYFKCICGNTYKFSQGLSKHKKSCNRVNIKTIETNKNELNSLTNLVLEVVKQNQELITINNETQKYNQELTNQLVKMCGNTINNTLINNTNSNNNTFNLQFFLHETCKDAMNITDFVDSLNLQLSDLEDVGKLGYVEGISNIIIKNLKLLDETKRPVHCTDKKRETIYIKDQGQWEKEDDNKTKLRKSIRKIAHKNIRLITQFREKYPECKKSESSISDKYNKMIIEAMGGHGDNSDEKEEKIMRNIAKNIVINK